MILGRLWKTARVGATRRSGCSHAIQSPWVAAQEILKLSEYLSRDESEGQESDRIPTNGVCPESTGTTPARLSSVSTLGPLTLGGQVHRRFELRSFLRVVKPGAKEDGRWT